MKETIQKHSKSTKKHSKYKYTYYQNNHTIVKAPAHCKTHTLQSKLKQSQYKLKSWCFNSSVLFLENFAYFDVLFLENFAYFDVLFLENFA